LPDWAHISPTNGFILLLVNTVPVEKSPRRPDSEQRHVAGGSAAEQPQAMMQQLIAELGMKDSSENALYWGLTVLSAIDQWHPQSFRYYMTGSPFEYKLVRKLSHVRRQFLVDN
jgi:hypothetical protein